MIGQEVVCARSECEVVFHKTTHNQKYCNMDCTRKATNARIMKNYHNEKDIRKGKPRWCKECLKTKLSRYNFGEVCSACESKLREDSSDAVSVLLGSVSWL